MERLPKDDCPLQRTRVVVIIDEETGELDYFVMRGRAEMIVLEQPSVALGLIEESKRCH
jgi:hypothetical protein